MHRAGRWCWNSSPPFSAGLESPCSAEILIEGTVSGSSLTGSFTFFTKLRSAVVTTARDLWTKVVSACCHQERLSAFGKRCEVASGLRFEGLLGKQSEAVFDTLSALGTADGCHQAQKSWPSQSVP